MAIFHMCTKGGGSMFFNALMEMTSSVAGIICIAQITFKLIYNTLPANDGWFPLLNSKLLANYTVCFGLPMCFAKIFEVFSDEVLRSSL